MLAARGETRRQLLRAACRLDFVRVKCTSTAPTVQRRDGTSAPLPRGGNPRGFIEYERKPEPYRPPAERKLDYLEINSTHEPLELKRQAARCMDCGTPAGAHRRPWQPHP